jgi:carbamoyl-phosphate synthase large subunit
VATRGTAESLREAGVEVEFVYKVNEGRPNIVDLVKSNRIDLVVNTPLGRESFFDEKAIRRAATRYNVPCITTLSGAGAVVNAIRALQRENLDVRSLQEYHEAVMAGGGQQFES